MDFRKNFEWGDSNMKKLLGIAVVIIFVLSASSVLYAGIVGSNHDFTFLGAGGWSFANDNDEPCVYCHTPHMALGAQTPLWNKSLNFPTGFSVYNSPTSDAVPANPPSTITLLCLGCHDGLGAINAVFNSPGPATQVMTPGGFDQIGDLGPLGNFINIGGQDPLAPTAIDLTNDHPVSINWADRGAGFYATPQDSRLELYNGVSVECTTCHDPHNGFFGGINPTGEVEFLVMSNYQSAMCLACHTK